MSPAERVAYFRDFWPAACAAKGWKRSDEQNRRAVVLQCMRDVRGPIVTTSDPQFGRDETTALFCYLDHLAHPADIARAARWLDCQKDYRAFNRARQADWYEAKAYGPKGAKKLRRERFAGQQSAAGGAFDQFDPAAIRKRFVTMASRAQKKQRKARTAATGQDLASHVPAGVPGNVIVPRPTDADPAYVPPVDQPF